jgi:hypothetical protein
MTIELVKELDAAGQVTYYVKVDNKFQSGTVTTNIPNAMEMYKRIKENYTKARIETLIKEEI